MGIVLTLAAGFASNAWAQSSDAGPGQQPPAEPPAPEEPKCISTDTSYKKVGNSPMFEIALTNSCEKRLRCTIHAYVVGAFGPATGKGTVILAPKSKGADAHKSYVMKVKQIGGTANISHECKAI
jgi:hypothetical protein